MPTTITALFLAATAVGTATTAPPVTMHLNSNRCGGLGILPIVQRCTDGHDGGSRPSTAPLSASWRIAARLSDSAARFAAAELQYNLSVTHGLNLSVVDSAALVPPADHRRIIALGVPDTDLALAAAARAAGLLLQNASATSAASLAATGPEGYFLASRSTAIFLLGSGPAGAFYAVQSLMQVVAAQGVSVPAPITISDWPDTPIRGAEIEAGPGGEDWWRLVGRTMARMKLNLLGPDSLQIPFGFNSTSQQILMPSADSVASIKRVQSYLADRYIDVALIVAAPKMDPRVLEGKWVRDEPFKFGERGAAVSVHNAATGQPVNGNFAHITADGSTPVGWTFDRAIGGSDTGLPPPCRLDRHNSADGNGNSIVCDVQQYPMPCPYSPAECNASIPHSSLQLSAARGRAESEPMFYNVSGPVSSDVFPILPGSMYVPLQPPSARCP